MKVKFWEEEEGVQSSSRLVFLAMSFMGMVQIGCGCYLIVAEKSVPLASAAWTAGIGSITTGAMFKHASRKQEDAK